MQSNAIDKSIEIMPATPFKSIGLRISYETNTPSLATPQCVGILLAT